MKPHNFHLAKQLLQMQAQMNAYIAECIERGEQVYDIAFCLKHADMALDIIGFPKDNSGLFMHIEEGNPAKLHFIREDIDNLFSRAPIYKYTDAMHPDSDFDYITQQLIDFCNELVLQRPHLFVQAA